MESKKDLDKMLKPAEVTIRTVDGSVLQGKVNLGKEERVSDVFTKSERQFIVLFNATYTGVSKKVLIINKAHIVWIEDETS
ncbi:MAG: hypothetical protein BBJ60_08740 [Desulfobacterales bacterium S7086C20]|nr:MAG: hypothetical protein BBJ60_08740 [Desulfobacterales bacterium S7086C20]